MDICSLCNRRLNFFLTHNFSNFKYYYTLPFNFITNIYFISNIFFWTYFFNIIFNYF